MTYGLRNGCLVVRFHGELDIGASSAVGAAIVAHLEPDDRQILVDLNGVTFMDSSAVRALLDCERRLGADGIDMTILDAPASARAVVRAVQTISDTRPRRRIRFWARR